MSAFVGLFNDELFYRVPSEDRTLYSVVMVNKKNLDDNYDSPRSPKCYTNEIHG